MARFAPITNPNLGQRNSPRTSSSTLRYYQERVPLLKNMSEVIGTTSAPSDQHQFAGTTPDGYAIWKKAEPAPAPQQSAPAPAPAPSGPSARELQITKEADAYRKATEEKLALADQTIAKLSDAQEQQRLATELQNRLAIQAQSSQARGAAQASLKIAPASQTAQTAGTQAFKRRRDQMRLAPIQTTAGINAPASSVLNV